MKKITLFFLTFSFLFSSFYISAQPFQLPDVSFETGWKLEQGIYGSFEEYETEFFFTLNSLYAVENDPLPADITAWKDVNSHLGNYCIKLVSGIIPLGEFIVFLPGMVGTLNPDFVYEFLGGDGDVTVTRDWAYDTPRALEGWYKYNPVEGDSALIDIGFFDYGDEIFIEKMIIKETVNDWTHFSVDIPQQYWSEYFNEIRVLFVASAGVNFDTLVLCKGQKGSTLWIDDIYLNYEVGIKQNLFSTLKANVFPNPVAGNEVLNFELNENFTGKIMIYNVSGSLVMEEKIEEKLKRLNISTLAGGNYIYKLMNDNIIFTQGKFVVAK